MNGKLDVTDEAILEMFERRARRATAADLRGPILARTVTMRQAGRRWTVPLGGIAGSASGARILVLMIVVAAALAAGLAVVGSRVATPERPEPSLAPSPVVQTPAKAIEDSSGPLAGTLYTSRLFEPSLTFQVTARTAGGAVGDICPPVETSSRSIVLPHPKGCVENLRIIRPWAVECAAVGDHPDADALAAAILAIPATTSSTDLGDLQADGAVPPGLFADRYRGRVVEMLGDGPLFAADVEDRDHCRLLPEPGSEDPVIEIRRDMSALFVLVDLDGELIVIRAGVAGHDTRTGAEAQARGYGQGGTDSLRHLLSLVQDIRFGR